jgi:hypothetical protein
VKAARWCIHQMGTPTAHNSKGPAVYLAVLLCIPAALARSNALFEAAPQHSTARFAIRPGTPAVAVSSRAMAAPADSSRYRSQDTEAGGDYGWLYPVLASSRKGSCVVYKVRSLHMRVCADAPSDLHSRPRSHQTQRWQILVLQSSRVGRRVNFVPKQD